MEDQAWTRTLPARAVRELIVCGVFDAIVGAYARREVVGREHVEQLPGPVLFVANHCSHVDTPVLLRALPRRRRLRTAVAAAADYFYTRRGFGTFVSLACCTVPIERGSGTAGSSTAALKPLIEDGWSLVVFPEGTRSRDGRVAPLRAGAAMLAAEHGLPIVPVHIAGTHAAMPAGRAWLSRPAGGRRLLARHAIRVSFGAPIPVGPRADRYEAMERVRLFMASCGADTTPDPKLAVRRGATARGAGAAGARGAAEAPGAGGSGGAVRPPEPAGPAGAADPAAQVAEGRPA